MKSLLTLVLPLLMVSTARTEPIPLKAGDHIVFLGNTLIEREQRYGYWELALTRRSIESKITFRNLGWSGDTVWGEARAGFDTPVQGFQRLINVTLEQKPSIILVSYGHNESFAGEAGLPRFVQGYEKLLDALAPAKARIIIVQPLSLEPKPAPLPDVGPANRNLAIYRNAIRQLAEKRQLPIVDLNAVLAQRTQPRTDNGMHLTAFGYRDLAPAFESAFFAPLENRITHDAQKGLAFRAKAPLIPLPPADDAASDLRVQVSGLPAGDYTLRSAGKEIATASAADWGSGVTLRAGPDVVQAEQVRDLIITKNEQFFHKWRPQNITYLLGFRKHEQGNNAKELAQFDPIVADKEAQILRLVTPTEHAYELIRK